MPSNAQLVENNLNEWFLENDRLVIPDLGELQANYVSAQLQPALNKATPPNKSIRFDESNKLDDGALAEFICKKENIQVEEAQKSIKLFVSGLKAELGSHRKKTLEGLGTFSLTPDSRVEFQASEGTNFFADSYGLPDLYNLKLASPKPNGTILKKNTKSSANTSETQTNTSHKKENKQPLPPPDNVDYSTEFIDEEGSGPSRRIFTVVTIVLVLVSTAAAYFLIVDQNPFWSSSDTNDTYAQQIDESLSRDNNAKDTENLPEDVLEETNTETDESRGEENIPVESSEPPPKPETTNPPITQPEQEDPPIVDYIVSTSYYQSFRYMPQRPSNATQILVNKPKSRYYVVLGSFDLEKNAYSFYNNLIQKGVSSAKIIVPGPGNPRYRVTYDDFASKTDAREQGKVFGKSNSLDLWVLAY